MTRRPTRLTLALAAALLIGSVAGSGAVATERHHGNGVFRDLVAAWISTARFQSPHQAEQAGYGLPPAPAPLHECIASFDGTGAMGYHYINGALLDAELDPRRPEALVYAPDRHGKLRLAALEYVVFKADWDAAHPSSMPMLFGQPFMETAAPNRYEIPAFYALHVWLWKPNPAGLFASFNRRVSCDGASVAIVRDLGSAPGATLAMAAGFTCAIDRRGTSATT